MLPNRFSKFQRKFLFCSTSRSSFCFNSSIKIFVFLIESRLIRIIILALESCIIIVECFCCSLDLVIGSKTCFLLCRISILKVRLYVVQLILEIVLRERDRIGTIRDFLGKVAIRRIQI